MKKNVYRNVIFLKGDKMIVRRPHQEIVNYLEKVLQSFQDKTVKPEEADKLEEADKTKVTKCQLNSLALCLTLITILGSICWARFSRATLGQKTAKGFGKAILNKKFPLFKIFVASTTMILQKFLGKGVLIIDDTDRQRSKGASILHKIFLCIDKKSGGYFKMQNLVILLYATKGISIPVGFRFFAPDPAFVDWQKEYKKQKKNGIPKKERLKKPPRNPEYLSRIQLGLELLQEFHDNHPTVQVCGVLADCAYGSHGFFKQIKKIYPQTQIVSQIKSNQNLIDCSGKKITVSDYFSGKKFIKKQVEIREKLKTVYFSSACIKVQAHGQKLHVIALKYEGEEKARYLISSNLTWRAEDIIQLYSYRWLIEVFNQDWKQYDGFGQMASQQGVDGASRSVLLSFLADHLFLSTSIQSASLAANSPLLTTGSSVRWLRTEIFFDSLKSILEDKDPKAVLKMMISQVSSFVDLRVSTKHMQKDCIFELDSKPSVDNLSKQENTGEVAAA